MVFRQKTSASTISSRRRYAPSWNNRPTAQREHPFRRAKRDQPVTKEKHNANQFPELFKLVQELQSKETHSYIGNLIGKDLSNSYVRVEVICDREGFWLKPHCDIKEKLLSCLLFVNRFGESENLGTDFYNSKMELVKTVPYKNNYGYFFSSDENSWHGMEKKEIKKDRRCIQVNYVTFKTDWPAA